MAGFSGVSQYNKEINNDNRKSDNIKKGIFVHNYFLPLIAQTYMIRRNIPAKI